MNLFLLVSPGTALRAMDIVFNLSLPYISFVKSMNILHKNVLTSSVVDRGFEPRLGQTKDYKIGICCFSGKHAALSRKNKD